MRELLRRVAGAGTHVRRGLRRRALERARRVRRSRTSAPARTSSVRSRSRSSPAHSASAWRPSPSSPRRRVRYVAAPEPLEASGRAVALCLGEPDRRFEPASPATTLRGRPGVRREDRRSVRPGGGRAGGLRVGRAAARSSRSWIRQQRGVTITQCSILDETLDAADVHLDGVAAAPLVLGGADDPVERVAAVAAVLASAEAVGAAAAVLELARDYAGSGASSARRSAASRLCATCSPTWSSRSRARGRACSTPPPRSTRESRTISGRHPSRRHGPRARRSTSPTGRSRSSAASHSPPSTRRIASCAGSPRSAASTGPLPTTNAASAGPSHESWRCSRDRTQRSFRRTSRPSTGARSTSCRCWRRTSRSRCCGTTRHGAKEFSGGLAEFHGYLAQRKPEGYAHHCPARTRTGALEVALGKTTRHGELVATFTMAAQLDGEGRAEKLFAARTTALPLDWPS